MSPASNYYRATTPARTPRPPLSGRTSAKVCIVGGGFAGLNTALGLLERAVSDVVLLEAQDAGFGASGRNGGFVFGGFSLGEEALAQQQGVLRASAMYGATTSAVELIRGRIDSYRIDCDRVDAGIIWANWFRDPEVLLERQRLLARDYDVHWEWLPREELRRRVLSDRYHDGLFEPRAFHFHPLKYAQGLADAAQSLGLRLYERSPAVSLQRRGAGWEVHTDQGVVEAEHVVLACGGYLAGLIGRVDAAVMPIATYVMVTEPLGDALHSALRTDAAVYDTRFAFDYYRPLRDTRLLWGGRISVRDRSPEAVQRLLCRDLHRVFPQLDGVGIDYAWSGLMSYARHQMPQIGPIDTGLWLAQAFGGHGVAPTTLAGEVIAAAIAVEEPGWHAFTSYGLARTWKPFGLGAAQVSYWWAQAKDEWKDWSERKQRERE